MVDITEDVESGLREMIEYIFPHFEYNSETAIRKRGIDETIRYFLKVVFIEEFVVVNTVVEGYRKMFASRERLRKVVGMPLSETEYIFEF